MNLESLERPARMVSVAKLGLHWYGSYFDAQKKSAAVAATITETRVDRRVAPDDQAIYAYLFAMLYLPYSGWIMASKLSRPEYERAAAAYRSIISEAAEVFCARPSSLVSRDEGRHPLTRFLQSIDGPTNCYPSLHVAFSVLAHQIIRTTSDPVLGRTSRKCCLDLCRSTMKIRQHSVIDVLGGYALARKTHRRYFASPFEDLLGEILPELACDELVEAKKAMKDWDTLENLLARLFELFPKVA